MTQPPHDIRHFLAHLDSSWSCCSVFWASRWPQPWFLATRRRSTLTQLGRASKNRHASKVRRLRRAVWPRTAEAFRVLVGLEEVVFLLHEAISSVLEKYSSMGNCGAKLEVELVRDKFQPGDVVAGSLVLHVKKPVVCESLTLVMEGREDLTVNHADGAIWCKEKFHTAEILSELHQKAYDPGCYRLPFKYQLDDNLRGQFTRSGVVGSHGMDLRSGYTLMATMKTSKKFGAKVEASKQVEVTKPRIEILPNAVREAVSEDVYTRHKKAELGVCHIAAKMDRDVQVQGQPVRVQWSVKNETSKRIAKVYLALRATYNSNSKLGSGQKIVLKRTLDSVGANESSDFDVELVLDRSKRRLSGAPMLVTTQSALLNVEFHVVIKCYFKRGTNVELVMPLRILPTPE